MATEIVITGAGIVSSIGNDQESVLRALVSGTSGIGTMRHLASKHRELPVGEVRLTNDEMKQQLGIPSSQLVSRTALMAMIAVNQALNAAHITKETIQGGNLPARQTAPGDGVIITGQTGLRVVLVSGTTVGGMDLTEQYFDTFGESDRYLSCLLQHDAGSSTRMVATHFGIFSDYTTVSTACSSAANALIVGSEMLRSGEADIVVAGGSEALTRFHLNGFNALMVLDHHRCRPFDEQRSGLNLGEGAAFVVMEREQQAQDRQIPIYAYLSGYGNACDAFHQTATSPDGEGAYRAMNQALSMAGIQPSDIDYVNAHGTGTPNNDFTESCALKRIFVDGMPPVSSTKSLTGHTCSASGSIETVISLLAMKHRFVPANVGWQHPMAEGIIPTMGCSRADLHHVMCNSFGFGGNDSSLIFSTVPRCGHDKDDACSCVPAQANDQKPGASPIRIASRVEINGTDSLDAIRQYVKPLERRRMGSIMKSSLLSSMQALEQAGITTPDAIITATPLGCLDNSEQLLRQLCEEGEDGFKPTLFMQSTHNTIGSNIAIVTHCHGYNITYSQGESSLEWALRDARRLLASGQCRNVLVGLHEETTPLYRSLMQRLGKGDFPALHSIAMVLRL